MGGTAASVAGNRRWRAVDFVPKGAQNYRARTSVTSLKTCIIESGSSEVPGTQVPLLEVLLSIIVLLLLIVPSDLEDG